MHKPLQQRAVLFVAGDLSGDAYMARLVERLGERRPELQFHALGGRQLGESVESRGGTWIGDTTNCSAIGLSRVIPIYFRAVWLQFKLRRFVRGNSVAGVVLCDWGGFNCRQLRFFKQRGVPVLYYFPPRSWQRGGMAGLSFAPMVAAVATPFKWSADRLVKVNPRSHWVGHPLLENGMLAPERDALRREFGAAQDEQLVTLLPGSRLSEIKVLGPRLAAAAEILARSRSVRFVVAVPSSMAARAREYFPPAFKIVVDRATDALVACDAAMVKMGTATLEAAVLGAPQVTFYDTGWVARMEWVFLWMWKRIPFMAMPNIILQRPLVPEVLGLNCRPAALATEISRLLDQPEERKYIEEGYQEIRRHLGNDLPLSATEQTVRLIEDLLEMPAIPSTASAAAVAS